MPAMTPTDVTFFPSPAAFRRWLEKHHAKALVLWVGFYKKDSGRPSITYPEALDEALCYGWIDGIRKAVDDASYTVRFTPRKPDSIWSLVNIRHVDRLTKLGRMMPPGIVAFESRDEEKSKRYSYENHLRKLDGSYEKKFRSRKKAWKFFEAQAPWYRRTASWWVTSAKREETRRKRLEFLIEVSDKQQRLAQLTSKKKA